MSTKVYVVAESYGEVLTLFATRELAEAYLEPSVRALWAKVLDPSVDLGHGWGGPEWRVKHYSAMGWEAFRAREMAAIEEHPVVGS